MRKFAKVLLIVSDIIGALLLLIVIGFAILFTVFGRDIANFDDSDLQLSKITIPTEDNAYYDLEKIGPEIEAIDDWSLIDDHLGGKVWDEGFVQNFLSENSKIFETIAGVAQKPKYQDPVMADPNKFSRDMVLPSLGYTRKIAKLGALHALILAKRGDFTDALNDLFNVLEIAQKVQDSQGSIIHYLVAVAMKEIILEHMREIIVQADLSSLEMIDFVERLEKFKKNEEGLKLVWKAEYLAEDKAIDDIVSAKSIEELEYFGEPNLWYEKIVFGKVGKNYYFKPNKLKVLSAEYARANINSVEKPCAFLKPTDIKILTPPLVEKYPALLIFVENAAGRIIHDVSAVGLTSFNKWRCLDDLSVSASQLLLAIKAYKQDGGVYPATLEDLVPQYIAKVPVDPFDGKDLRYSQEKRIIYSVGANSIDESGSNEEKGWTYMSDPTFKIGF